MAEPIPNWAIQAPAHYAVKKALQAGVLHQPDCCERCNGDGGKALADWREMREALIAMSDTRSNEVLANLRLEP